MSWIHVDDLISLFLFAIERNGVSGPVNGVAAEAARNAEFTQALAAAVQRPALLPVPGFALKLLFGEMAEEIMLASQKIVPKAAEEAGFMFGHPELRGALRSLLG
jgi:NAD dependent epimerase/dehydratase family enzyme